MIDADKKELLTLREFAAGRCVIQTVIAQLGPMSLWSKNSFDREIASAVAAERERLAAKLRAAIDLDGFGCACEPNRQCSTCNARSVLFKVLTPIANELTPNVISIRAEP